MENRNPNPPPDTPWERSTLPDDADLIGLESFIGDDLQKLFEQCLYVEAIAEVLIGEVSRPTPAAMLIVDIPTEAQLRIHSQEDTPARGLTRWMLLDLNGVVMFVCHLVTLDADGHEFMLTGPVFKETRDLMAAADTLFIVPVAEPDPLTRDVLTIANDQAFWTTAPLDLPGFDDCRTS